MKTTILVLYRRNLKMSEGKLAAQAVHAVLGLPAKYHDPTISVRVLMASNVRFASALQNCKDKLIEHYVHHDLGLTELAVGTQTCLAMVHHEYE